MPYYHRLFSTDPTRLSFADVQSCLPDGVEAELSSGSAAKWESVLLQSKAGDAICLLERADPELIEEEANEFIDELADARPKTGASWVSTYLNEVRQLVSCQVMESGFGEVFGHVPGTTLWNIMQRLKSGIIQSDGEGFTNHEGYGVVWQFSDDVTGPWAMAVLTDSGSWHKFQMDLGDKAQRADFQDGRVPKGARLIR